MKRFLLSACAGALALAMAGPSFGADLPRKAPALYVAPFSWTGFYVGINGGYGWGNTTLTTPAGSMTSATQNGWLIGGTLGYNLQTGNWVWGIEGDLDYTAIKGNNTNTFGAFTVKDTYFGTVRGRIGYAFDRFLPYITGGAAFSSAKISNAANVSETDTNWGWTAGVGLEYAFLGAWSAKIEYLYADLDNGNCSATVCGVSTNYETKVNIVRAGINYRF